MLNEHPGINQKIVYREFHDGEEKTVCRLVQDCFSEFVASEYSREGITEFMKYIDPELMKYRISPNHFILLALHS